MVPSYKNANSCTMMALKGEWPPLLDLVSKRSLRMCLPFQPGANSRKWTPQCGWQSRTLWLDGYYQPAIASCLMGLFPSRVRVLLLELVAARELAKLSGLYSLSWALS